MDKTGKHLGTIVHGEASTTNMARGGQDWRTLYFTTRHILGSVQMKLPEVAVPAQK